MPIPQRILYPHDEPLRHPDEQRCVTCQHPKANHHTEVHADDCETASVEGMPLIVLNKCYLCNCPGYIQEPDEI